MALRMASRSSLASAVPWAWSLPARPRIRASVSSSVAGARERRPWAGAGAFSSDSLLALGRLGVRGGSVVGDQPFGARGVRDPQAAFVGLLLQGLDVDLGVLGQGVEAEQDRLADGREAGLEVSEL